jgi:hypothetical protein
MSILGIGRIFKHFKVQCDCTVANGLASSITRASPSLPSKIAIKIPALTYHRLLLLIVLVLDSFNQIRRLRTNEPTRLRRNRRFFRQLRKRTPKVLRLRRAPPTTIVPHDPSAFVHASRPRSAPEAFGAHLILTFSRTSPRRLRRRK